DRNRSFEELATIANWNSSLSGEVTPERVTGVQVTGNLFAALGVQTELGRALGPEDAQPGSTKVVNLGHGFWARHYGGDPRVIGRAIHLNGEVYTVVGVLPPTFVYRQVQDDVVAPLVFEQDPRRSQRANSFLRTIGRLKSGVSKAQASDDLVGILKQLQTEHPDTNANRSGAAIEGLQDSLVGKVKSGLLLLFGAVTTVLLIACANLAALQLVRASERGREMAIRVSLGATRSRLMRQLLTESVVLALLGGVAGLVVAYAGTQGLVAMSPASLPRAKEIGMSWEVVLFTLAISILCGIVCGLAPTLEQVRVSLSESMKEGERGGSGGKARLRLRHTLGAGQNAVSLDLLSGSG